MSSSGGASTAATLPAPAERLPGGVCRGTLGLRADGDGSSSSIASAADSGALHHHGGGYYCELVGNCLHVHESRAAYSGGDAPVRVYETVGSAACDGDNSNNCSFRLVTTRSTTVRATCANASDRSVWLAALQTGLEWSLSLASSSEDDNDEDNDRLQRPRASRSSNSAKKEASNKAPARPSFFRSGSNASSSNKCAVCGEATVDTTSTWCVPAGCETRRRACGDCCVVEGLWDHLWRTWTVQQMFAAEQEHIARVRQQCRQIILGGGATKREEGENQPDSFDSSEDSDDWTRVSLAADYVHLESKPWQEYLQSPEFQIAARQCPPLQELQRQDCNSLERLDELAGISQAAELKRQAFTVAAADLGTALHLLQEQCFATASASNGNNTIVLRAVLEFLWNLCCQDSDDSSLGSVAFFWPQLCHLHLRMLPAASAVEHARVRLFEDFLLAVATRCSIHLALELVWSHAADLEESLCCRRPSASLSSSSGNNSGSSSKDASAATTTAAAAAAADGAAAAVGAPHCRRRRYAVLQFVCELESLLFDLDGGWGGGSVALGPLLRVRAPAGAQRLKRAAACVRRQRPPSPFLPRHSGPPQKTPEEKLRIARNADYFSSHLAFSKRLADVAEKLRFLELGERASFLQRELVLLNSSGTMGGDPLNRVRPVCHNNNNNSANTTQYLTRVVRVPPTEGHVFRSKERTPVLLLMEVVDEEVAALQEEGAPPREEEAETRTRTTTTTTTNQEQHETDHPRGNSNKEQQCTEQPPVAKPALQVSTKLEEAAAAESSTAAAVATNPDEAKDETISTPPLPPPPPADEDADSLHPSKHSPGPKALKRFDHGSEAAASPAALEAPTTPKHDIQQMVNTVAQEQLKEMVLPDLSRADGAVGTVKEARQTAQDSSFRAATSDATTEKAPLPLERVSSASNTKERSGSISTKRINTLGSLGVGDRTAGDSTNTLAPTGDIRRAVLTTIMMRGLQGNTIAAGAADSVQRSLQELERKRATELLLSDDDDGCETDRADTSHAANVAASSADRRSESTESTRQKMASLGLSPTLEEVEFASRPSEEDECMEAIRLMLIQNRVAQGQLSPADAAKVLQHTSLSPSNKRKPCAESFDGPDSMDMSDHPTIDAGDVDPRLVGCGPLPPAVLQALTLWKGGMVTHAELLELVKKDIEFVKHSILVDAESVDKLKENSAFWGRFAFGERWAEKKARIGNSSPEGSVPGWDLLGVIVKSNDDLRQEAFVMQLIELSQEAFELAGLELWVSPYRILATGRTTGIIECVRNAMSFDALKKRPGYGKGGLREHLQRMTEFTADPGDAFKTAQQNFVRSLAAYSLLSYLFLFKDRHNGNLLLDTAAHVVHIDFGFVFGIAPGGSFSLEMSTPFKLTEEMLDVMGGLRSPLFSEFVTLFCCGFLALQQHCDTFLTIVEITSKESTFKCFEGRDSEKVVAELRERFAPDLSKEDTVSFALDLIKQATTSYGTRQYDLFQYLSQGIVA